MKGPTDDRLLAFLEGRMPDPERADFLDALDADPELAARLHSAAAGHEAALDAQVPTPARAAGNRAARRIPWWWVPLTAAAAFAVAVPVSLSVFASEPDPAVITGGLPQSADPSFVLVLHGRWPDAESVSTADQEARSTEYWAWTTSLAQAGVLVAAGDLRWEAGQRIGAAGRTVPVPDAVVEDSDFVVGMFALRVMTYDEALAVARDCPHLRYGGSVSVRRVGGGLVTVPGMDDWTD